MKLAEVFSQLTYGEFSQLHLGGGSLGEISDSNYDMVLAHINLGLTALYKRFSLKQSSLNLSLQTGKLTYVLNSNFAVNNSKSTELIRYINDSVSAKFTDDILKVEGVYTESGWELGLNDSADAYSVTTPSAAVLRVPTSIVERSIDLPEPLKTSKLDIVYRANHPIVSQGFGSFDPMTYELELPYSHLEPLLYFVASRVNNPIGMVNEFHAGNSYAAKYEQACQQLEVFNLEVDQNSQPDRISRNGWV